MGVLRKIFGIAARPYRTQVGVCNDQSGEITSTGIPSLMVYVDLSLRLSYRRLY